LASSSIRVTYVLSNINKALAFEWIAEELSREKFALFFILLNPTHSVLESFLLQKGVPVLRVTYRGKKDLPKAIIQITRFLLREKIQVVHCHLFDACIAGLLAAKLAGVKKRIYTRHYATFHQVYFPRAVYYDKFISSLATHIVAISENVKEALLREGVNNWKIRIIHHGFQLNEFSQVPSHRVANLRAKYKLHDKGPVVGVISRYFELKGIQYIIPAFKKLLTSYPEAHLVLANATGDYTAIIKSFLAEIPEENYTEILFEEDITALYKLFDVFVHVPINANLEAFGQTYVEALAAGVPSVFTLSGVAPEFIVHKKNAWVVPFCDSESIFYGLKWLIFDKPLRESISRLGRESVIQKFQLEKMIEGLEYLYLRHKD
jgi:glycosyltransferase involved in cell wall biosynthesis